MNILIISAHPDDETIGMGGTIAKLKTEGHQVFWLIMTKAFSPKWSRKIVGEKQEEIKKVAKYFGFEKVYQTNFKTASLSTYPQYKIIDEISKIIKQTQAELVYIPPLTDIHQDHQITSNSALVAARPQYKSTVKKIVSYELPVTTVFSRLHNNFQLFSTFVDISKFAGNKLSAMSLYKSELMAAPHPRSLQSLELFTKERGIVSGFEFAEAFSLVFEKVK